MRNREKLFDELPEHVFGQRVVEVFGNVKISSDCPENTILARGLDASQPSDRLAGFRNHELFSKSDPVQDLGQMGLSVVDVYFHTLIQAKYWRVDLGAGVTRPTTVQLAAPRGSWLNGGRYCFGDQ